MHNHKNLRFVDKFFDEFSHLNKNKDDVENLYNFAKRITCSNTSMDEIFTYRQLEGFVIWDKFETSNWAPAWFDIGVLIMVDDHSYACDLPSIRTKKNQLKDDAKYSIYNFPYHIQKKWLEKNRRIVSTDGHVCGRSELTYDELEEIKEKMNTTETSEYANNMWKQESHYSDKSFLTKENPVRIYMCGTDDYSYTCHTSNMKKANEIISDILNEPSMTTLFKNEFFFSN